MILCRSTIHLQVMALPATDLLHPVPCLQYAEGPVLNTEDHQDGSPFLLHASLLPALPPEESRQDAASIFNALMKLPEQQRSVVVLFYYEELAQKDISEILSIPVGTVKSRLHAAKMQVRHLIRDAATMQEE